MFVSFYYVLGTAYGAKDTTMNRISQNSNPHEAYIVVFWKELL